MMDLQPNKPRTGRSRWQFSLRGLFLIVLVVALAMSWYVIHRDIEAARYEWEYARAGTDSGGGTYQDACEASRALRDAECRMPFSSNVAAGTAHLARLQRLELDIHYRQAATMYGPGEVGRLLNIVRERRKEAELWLERQ